MRVPAAMLALALALTVATGDAQMLADSRDGVPLASGAGPYRLIVPFDKREGRWVRQVTDVELAN